MAPTSIPLRPIATSLATLPAIYFAVHLYGRLSPAPRDRITTRTEVAASLRDSNTIRHLVNPQDRVQCGDSRSVDLDVPAGAARLKDEALLAAFARGFFGGSVFGPERFVLGLIRPAVLNFPELGKPSHIWDAKHLDGDSLAPKHTVLFGAFQIGDISLRQNGDAPAEEQRPSESTVDVVFGSNTSTFAGAHRFSIARSPDRPGTIRVSLQCSVCNPLADQDIRSSWLFTFHCLYSGMLFRESVGEVQRRLRLGGE